MKQLAKYTQKGDNTFTVSDNEHGTISEKTPLFPTDGSSCIASSLTKVSFQTILSHAVKSGKRVSPEKDGCFLAMQLLDRANEFFYRWLHSHCIV